MTRVPVDASKENEFGLWWNCRCGSTLFARKGNYDIDAIAEMYPRKAVCTACAGGGEDVMMTRCLRCQGSGMSVPLFR